MLHPFLNSVSAAFRAARIRWSLLRLPAQIGTPNGGDVDLLVAFSDLERARQSLENLGFVNVSPYPRSVHVNYVSYNRSTDCWLWLDIVTELSFGRHNSLRTGAEEQCLARCLYQGGMPRLAPDDDFWTLLLHCLLDKGYIADRHRATLHERLRHARTDGPVAHAFETYALHGWSLNRVLACVSAGDWTVLENMAPDLAAATIRRHTIAPVQMLHLRLTRLVDRLKNLHRYRGLSIALLGPDGAGKTTLMKAIQGSFIFPVRPMYMGLTGGILRYVGLIHLPGLVSAGRLMVFWGRYLLARYHQARGRLVVFDRYIYDAMVPHPERLNWLRRVSRWVDGHACPGPDMVLVLDAPGSVMYERKGEYSPDILEEWRRCFLALQHRFPQVEIIDTTQGKDFVRIEAIDRIWQRYVCRWGSNSANPDAHEPSEQNRNATTSL